MEQHGSDPCSLHVTPEKCEANRESQKCYFFKNVNMDLIGSGMNPSNNPYCAGDTDTNVTL